jgi:heat shock protein 4
MQNADELAIATAEARNALESYSYDAQGKLQYDFSEWVEFASEEEKTKLLAMVDEVLAWLYGEGDSATRETYQTKLNELQVLGSPIELRKTESEAREPAIQELMEAIKYYKAFVNTKEEKYAHISEEQRQKVTDKINETEDWLNKMTTKQQELPKTADPVLLSSEISNKKEALTLFSNVIVNTPVPKKTEPKKEEAKKEENMQTESTTSEGETTTTDDASKTEGETDLPKAAEDGKIEELDENAVEKPSDDMDVD